MKKIFYNYSTVLTALLAMVIVLGSCKYQKVDPANYPGQKIYMSSADVAINGPNATGIFSVNTVAVPGQVYRYIVDLPNAKFNVPLGIIRAGVELSGDITVGISATTDTIAKLITANRLTADTQVLPASAYTLANSVTVPSGSSSFTFPLVVNLNFLLAHPNTKYALSVGITTTQTAVNTLLSKTIVLIDTQFLIPTATFTNAADPGNSKKINFTNTSLNGVAYTWDFGDGTAVVTDKSPSHIYAAAGTYNVKLTTVGATGIAQQTTVTNIVVVN